jgi:hypothetical protein
VWIAFEEKHQQGRVSGRWGDLPEKKEKAEGRGGIDLLPAPGLRQ